MLASRVGVLGALVASLVLSVELVGAVALQHRIAGEDRDEPIAKLQRIETSLAEADRSISIELERVEPKRRARCGSGPHHEMERDAKRALEDAITARKGLGDTQVPNRAGY
jgi:hypothetical protein